MLKDLKFDAFEGPSWAYSNMSLMSSATAAHVPEALASPSKATYRRVFNRRHLDTLLMRSHKEVLRDAQRFFIELCVNPHPRTHNILVNAADNQRQMADLFDYNVAHNSQNDPEFCRKPAWGIRKRGLWCIWPRGVRRAPCR